MYDYLYPYFNKIILYMCLSNQMSDFSHTCIYIYMSLCI